LAVSERARANKSTVRGSVPTTGEQAALGKCLALIGIFRALRRLMPLQHAYTFIIVALEEGLNVSEYANRARTTQPVMTRILFALGSHNRGRQAGYGLVQQLIDPHDARRTRTFLTVRGKALVHEIMRTIRSDRRHATRLRKLLTAGRSRGDLQREQWLSRLVDVGRKLRVSDIQLVIRQAEAVIRHRRSRD
jgi:DNA-binding MarR family transcriptional regulator